MQTKKVIYYKFILLFLFFVGCDNPSEFEQIANTPKKPLAKESTTRYTLTDSQLLRYEPKSGYDIGIWPAFYWYTNQVPAYDILKNVYGFRFAMFQHTDQYYRAKNSAGYSDNELVRILSPSGSVLDWTNWSNEFPTKGIYIDEPVGTHGRSTTELQTLYNSISTAQEFIISDTRSSTLLTGLRTFLSANDRSTIMFSSYVDEAIMWSEYESFFPSQSNQADDRSRMHWITVEYPNRFSSLLNHAKNLDPFTNEVWLYCADPGSFSYANLEAFCEAAWQTGWLKKYCSNTYLVEELINGVWRPAEESEMVREEYVYP